MGLTNKQQVFVNEYLQCWNATEAARRAGYSLRTAYSIGQENLKKPEIAAEIQARIDEKTMSADEVLIRLADMARSDMGDFVEFKDGIKTPYLDLKSAYDKGLFKQVKKFKYDAAGRPEIELYDRMTALLNIGKQHGLFTDKHTVNVRLEKEIDSVLDVLENVLPPEWYDRVLTAISGETEGSGAEEAETDRAESPSNLAT